MSELDEADAVLNPVPHATMQLVSACAKHPELRAVSAAAQALMAAVYVAGDLVEAARVKELARQPVVPIGLVRRQPRGRRSK